MAALVLLRSHSSPSERRSRLSNSAINGAWTRLQVFPTKFWKLGRRLPSSWRTASGASGAHPLHQGSGSIRARQPNSWKPQLQTSHGSWSPGTSTSTSRLISRRSSGHQGAPERRLFVVVVSETLPIRFFTDDFDALATPPLDFEDLDALWIWSDYRHRYVVYKDATWSWIDFQPKWDDVGSDLRLCVKGPSELKKRGTTTLTCRSVGPEYDEAMEDPASPERVKFYGPQDLAHSFLARTGGHTYSGIFVRPHDPHIEQWS